MTDLESMLRTALDATEITDLCRLSGGASRETWSFSADGDRLILQQQRAGAVSSSGTGMGAEAALLRAAATAGVPVAPLRYDGSATERPFIVSEAVDGETIARKILRDD